MDKLTAIKIKYKDGTYSNEIPVSVLAENVKWNNNNNLNLTEVLGNVKVTTAGTVQNQIDALANEKADVSDVTSLGTRMTNVETDVTVINTQVSALGNGSPTPAGTVAEMTEHDKVYLYTGSEPNYTAGNWYFWNGSAWTSGGQYGGAVTDTTLSIRGSAADAKAVGDAIDALDDRVTALESGGGGLTADIKSALLACFRGVAWKGDVNPDVLYSALDTALNPPANLTSISAVYTQSGAVDVGASLDSLRADLVVTAHYSDSTSAVVTAYTLSGSLSNVGTNTITVSYGGKTTTFTVNVTSSWTYIWDLTDSLTDKVSGRVAVASAGSGVNAPAITSDGLAFNAATQMVSFGDIDLTGKTIEIDVASMDFKGLTSAHIRFLCNMLANGAVGIAPIIYHKDSGWAAYIRSGASSSPSWTTTWTSTKDRNLFGGKTVKLVSGSESTELYLDGELLRSLPKFTYEYGGNAQNVCIAGLPSYSQSGGDQCYDMVISAVRIKETEVA